MSRPMWQAQRKHEAEDNKTKQETGDKISETKIRYTEMHIEYDTAEKLSYIASEVFLWILDTKHLPEHLLQCLFLHVHPCQTPII